MKYLIYLSISMNLLLFISCQKKQAIFINKKFNNTIIIDEWKVIGPFTFNTKIQADTNTFNNKDLELFGIDENCFDEEDFKKIENPEYKPFIFKSPHSVTNIFDHLSKDDNKQNKSNIYLYTNIESECEQEVVFIFDGSSSYKVWLNKERVLDVFNKENTVKYGEYFLRIKLHKGKNTLFVKLNRGSNQYSWCFLAIISSIKEGKSIWREKYLSDFVYDPQVSDSLNLYLGPYKYAQLQIKDLNNRKIFSTSLHNKLNQKNISISFHNLKDGFYNARLVLENNSIDEIIYKGDIQNFINNTKLKIDKSNYNNQVRNDLNAAVNRLDFLISRQDDRSEAGKKYYHRNIIFYSKNLSDLIEYVTINNNTKYFTGTIIKTFYQDNIDKIQYYMFHVDKKTIKKELALILFIPYEINEESLPESWYIGNLDAITFDIKNAERYNFALVWPFLKGKDYKTSDEAVKEIRDIINRIREDYNIDTSQIYLNGECVGGQRALLIGAKASNLFAGISVKSPITITEGIGENPYNHIHLLKHMPIAIRHGIYDNTVAIKETRHFVMKVRNEGIPLKYTETKSGHINITNIDRIYNFTFFDSIRNSKTHIHP